MPISSDLLPDWYRILQSSQQAGPQPNMSQPQIPMSQSTVPVDQIQLPEHKYDYFGLRDWYDRYGAAINRIKAGGPAVEPTGSSTASVNAPLSATASGTANVDNTPLPTSPSDNYGMNRSQYTPHYQFGIADRPDTPRDTSGLLGGGTGEALGQLYKEYGPKAYDYVMKKNQEALDYLRKKRADREAQAAKEADKQSINDMPQVPLGPASSRPAGTNAPVQPGKDLETQDNTQTQPSSLADYFKQADAFYKQAGINPDYKNPYQEKADAYAQQELKRTKALAQLALAAGVTSAGGGAWQQVGQGFANAAGAYDQGFRRYQQALQNSADRYQQLTNQEFKNRQSKAEFALGLYKTEAATNLARAKQGWEQEKQSRDDIKSFFATIMKDVIDPQEKAKLQAAYERSLQLGRVTLPTDVRK